LLRIAQFHNLSDYLIGKRRSKGAGGRAISTLPSTQQRRLRTGRRASGRFGVSRTHVRKLLQDAERADLVRLSGQGERLVALKPAMLSAFDRFVAESMSGHDLLFGIALSRTTSGVGA
jgi:hypothetical protein